VLNKTKKHRRLSRLDPEKRFDDCQQVRGESIGPDQSIPGFPSGISLAGVREDASPGLADLFQESMIGVVYDHPDGILNGPAATRDAPEGKMALAVHESRQEVDRNQARWRWPRG
jgi:hypothetical protein